MYNSKLISFIKHSTGLSFYVVQVSWDAVLCLDLGVLYAWLLLFYELFDLLQIVGLEVYSLLQLVVLFDFVRKDVPRRSTLSGSKRMYRSISFFSSSSSDCN